LGARHEDLMFFWEISVMRPTFAARVLFTAILHVAALSPLPCRAADTVFFVVRHAEKAAATHDPPLSPAGVKRAQQLMQILENLNVTAIYHTNYVRTKQTAQPLAEKLGIMPSLYGDADQSWIDSTIASQRGKRTLIVGHSETISDIAGRLSGKPVPATGEEYDNLFIVVISDEDKSVVRLKYGKTD
jgi:broad specificity phosphatase PhoE